MKSNHLRWLLLAPTMELKSFYRLNNSLNRHNLDGYSCRTNFYFFRFCSTQANNTRKFEREIVTICRIFFSLYFAIRIFKLAQCHEWSCMAFVIPFFFYFISKAICFFQRDEPNMHMLHTRNGSLLFWKTLEWFRTLNWSAFVIQYPVCIENVVPIHGKQILNAPVQRTLNISLIVFVSFNGFDSLLSKKFQFQRIALQTQRERRTQSPMRKIKMTQCN